MLPLDMEGEKQKPPNRRLLIILVNLTPSIYNLIVMEIVRWNDVIRNIYAGSNSLAAS